MLRPIGLVLLAFASGSLQAADIAACQSCHSGVDRRALAPNLDGQQGAYLVNQLTRFREHLRDSFPMDALSQGLDDATIGALAQTLAKRPWPPASPAGPTDSEAEGLLDRFGCRSCHGPQLHGGDEIPRLAGQQADYLDRQLRAFAGNQRYHPPAASGAPLATLSAAEREKLARLLASSP